MIGSLASVAMDGAVAPAPPTGGRWPALTVDPALPLLARLADPLAARVLLSQALGAPVLPTDLRLVKHRPGRRCILRAAFAEGEAGRAGYPVAAEPAASAVPIRGASLPEARPGASAPPAGSVLYLKLYASGRASAVARRTAVCGALGACGPAVDLPPVLAAWEAGGLVVLGGLGGLSFVEALLQGRRGLVRRLAEGLAHLHAIAPEDLSAEDLACFPLHDAERELRPLRRRLAELEAARPGLAGAAAGAVEAVDAVLAGADRLPWRRRLLHRDLHPEQVLVAGRRLAILDWDDAALGEPAIDLANFAAHLRLAALCDPPAALAARLTRAAGAVLSWGRRLDPQLSPLLLRLLEAATLLRLATLHLDRSLTEPQVEALLCGATRALRRAWRGLTDDLAGR